MKKLEEKLEEANNLIVEAKYVIEEVINSPQYPNILGLNNLEYLESVNELIAILAKIENKKIGDLPTEAVYKSLYLNYKKGQAEIKKLKKDLKYILERNDLDEDKQVLIVKLMRAEREIESQRAKNDSLKEQIKKLKLKYSSKIKALKAELNAADDDTE